MNLVDSYLNLGFENIPIEIFSRILKDDYPSLTIKRHLKGMIMLNDNTLIKCAKKYYNVNGDYVPKSNNSNECYHIQKFLGINNVENYDCRKCHMECINNLKKGLINKSVGV